MHPFGHWFCAQQKLIQVWSDGGLIQADCDTFSKSYQWQHFPSSVILT